MDKPKIAVTFYSHLDTPFMAKVEAYRKENGMVSTKQALIALAVKGLSK